MPNCSICLESMEDESHTLCHTLPECGHCFHTACAIQWFRSGNESCPLCRGKPDEYIGYIDAMSRYALLRRKSRARNAPRELKAFVRRIQKVETTVKSKRADIKALRGRRAVTFEDATVQQILTKLRRTKAAVWAAESRLCRLKRSLGMADFERDGFRLPNVVSSYTVNGRRVFPSQRHRRRRVRL